MANIRNSEVTCLKDLKFIQLKNYQITSDNVNGSGNCLAIDHQNQKIYICCCSELICVSLDSLLNFDIWSKNFLKQIDSNIYFETKILIDDLHVANLISISCKGYGSKIAVACHSLTQPSSIIYFYHKDSIEKTKESTKPFNHFNFSVNKITKICSLIWHPEISDNIFACSLTDGSFFIIYVGDYPSKTLTVLTQFNTANQIVSTFCWSPKGKQIVLCHGDSIFVQYKFHFNEQNIVLSNGLQETKRSQLPESFQKFHICNIYWVSTFNFIIIGRNEEENETCYILVSIPSSKATGSDAIMKIVDFGRLIIECCDESNEKFEANICSLENLIFFYTNKSYEFAIIGSTFTELTNSDNWNEISNDDNYRLMFSEADDSLQIRGFSFAHGTSRQFQFSTSILKGGINQPFAMAYNSLGQLTLFLVDYENNSEFIKVPTAPKCLKPQVTLQQQQQQQQTLPPLTTSISAIQKNVQSTQKSESNLSQKIEYNSQQSLLFSSSNNLNSKSTISEADNKKSLQLPILSKQLQQPPKQNTTSQKRDNEIANKIEDLYSEEISINIKEFDNQLRQAMNSLANILQKTNIGSIEKQDKLRYESKFMSEMLDNLSSSYSSLNHDVNDLQTSCLELQYLMEESRALMDLQTDPKYKNILQRKNLDPITTRRMKDIQVLKDYIEIQLRELNNKFDLEWKEWLQRIKLFGSSSLSLSKTSTFHDQRQYNSFRNRSPPTLPHLSFINKEKVNNFNDDIKSKNVVSFVYKALVNNQQSIDNLKSQIIELINQQQNKTINKFQNDEQDLIRLVCNVSLEQSCNVKNLNLKHINEKNINAQERYNNRESIVIQCMNYDRKLSLRNFLENRHSVPIRVCRSMQFGDKGSKYINEKSRFASVLEKIKLRRKTLNETQQQQDIKSIILNDNVDKIKDDKKDKIINSQIEKIPTTSQSICPVTTTTISTTIQQQNLSTIPSFTFKSPPQQKQSTAVFTVSLPKFQYSISTATTTTTLSSLQNSTKSIVSNANSNLFTSTNNEPLFRFGADNKNVDKQITNTSYTTLSSLLSSSKETISKPSNDLNNSNLLPFIVNSSSTTNKITNHPIAVTTQTITTTSSAILSTKLPSFSSSMFENVTSKISDETKLSNSSKITGGDVKSIQSSSIKDKNNLNVNNTDNQVQSPNSQEHKEITLGDNSFVSVKPSFTFDENLLKTNDTTNKSSTTLTDTNNSIINTNITSDNNVENKINAIPSTTTATITTSITAVPIVTTSSSTNDSLSALKSSFPSFSSSLFGESQKPQPSTITTTTTTEAQQPQISFNFNKTLTNLSLGFSNDKSSITSTTTATLATTTTTTGNSIFGGGNIVQSSTSPFGQTSLFGNTTSNTPFGTFSFGGAAQSPFGQQGSINKASLTPQEKTQTSLFGQPQQQQSPFSSKPFQPLNQTSTPFNPSQSTNVFGGSPLFGGSPTFGSSAIFGGTATFGSQTAMMSSFNNSDHSFGSMAFKNEPMPSFDSLANDNNNRNSSSMAPGFGQGSGGGLFFNSKISQQNSDAFTQRRG